MTYKVKSLLYFVAFLASALIYNSLNDEMAEETAKVPKPEKLADAVTDSGNLQEGEETVILDKAMLRN